MSCHVWCVSWVLLCVLCVVCLMCCTHMFCIVVVFDVLRCVDLSALCVDMMHDILCCGLFVGGCRVMWCL